MIEEFPGRVLAVYLRDVTGDERRAEIAPLIERAREAGVPMLLTVDTSEAVAHAAAQGFIAADGLQPDPQSHGEVAASYLWK